VRVVLAVAGARGRALLDGLHEIGDTVHGPVDPELPAQAAADALTGADAAELLAALARADLLVVSASRSSVTAELVGACDRFGVRVVALCAGEEHRRVAEVYGLRAVPVDADAAMVRDATDPAVPAPERPRGRVTVVWGPGGAPGRTTVAIELACELARDGRRVALVDADSHGPSVALATGLADEGPGFAAACRQAERGQLTVAELTRIALPLGAVQVLTGLNRPSRWHELTHDRVHAALTACRDWVDDVVVDVAAPLERDEEIVSDLDGPRRNAATLAAFAAADVVVAVVAADPVGVSRFVRAHAELRAAIGATPVRVLVNKTRTGALGFDAHTQVRRAIERYTGLERVWFAPWDGRATDAALLRAQPIAHVAARSTLGGAVRRFVGEALEPPVPQTAARRRRAKAPARALARA
jgi:MinD-like ATPase involved in chromosome partitioning or flagellar assembly